MAKVSGPLMSMNASGAFAGTLVFANRKGQNVVRNLVIPANPMSTDQVTARNIVRVCGAAQKFANVSTLKGDSRASTDKALLIAAAPNGQTWNSTLVKGMTGAQALVYDAATTLWGTLAADHAAWEAAAGGLTPVFPEVAQYLANNVADTPMTAGEAFFHYQYGLYSLGIAAIPTGVPPTYA